MAAAITFMGGLNAFSNLNGSGLGFYGASFGTSVQVGQYQDSTFVTDGNGTVQGPATNNCKWASSSGVKWRNVAGDIRIQALPNQSGSVQVRFTYDTPVKTQNAQARIFDRVNKDNDPVGVTAMVAELVHPDLVVTLPGSPSGSATWVNAKGSGTVLTLTASPGYEGARPSGVDTIADTHDWYLAMSASPDSIGSKTSFGLYVELEYL
jgi:hypothetical protein